MYNNIMYVLYAGPCATLIRRAYTALNQREAL